MSHNLEKLYQVILKFLNSIELDIHIRTLGSIFQVYKLWLSLRDRPMKIKLKSIQYWYVGLEEMHSDEVLNCNYDNNTSCSVRAVSCLKFFWVVNTKIP